MKKTSVFGTLAIIAMALVGCGGSTGGSTDTTTAPSATTISSLPKATSPMASASADIAVPKGVLKAATTGLNLLTATTTSFQATDSMAGCQVTNVVKSAIISASQADQILCYVQAMNGALSSVTDGGRAVNVYDGQYHIFNLNIAGATQGDGGPDKIKVKIVKNGAGNITSFEMFMCKRVNSVETQNEYTSQTLNGTAFAMHSRGNYASSEWSGSHQVDVAGTLNAAGAYTEKTITMKNSGSSATNTNWQEATLTQTPGAFTLNGYQKGTYSNGGDTGTYQEAAYGAGEMLGDTSTDISNLALGDGAVKVGAAYTWSSTQFGSGSDTRTTDVFAWLGDTMAPVTPATDSTFYSAANSGTTPTPAESVSVTFDTDQTWDCSDDVATAVTLPEVQDSDLQTACSQYGQNDGYISCYDVIGRQEQH